MKYAPLHFGQVINLMLGDLVDLCVLVYLYDIIIFLAMTEHYTRHTNAVF